MKATGIVRRIDELVPVRSYCLHNNCWRDSLLSTFFMSRERSAWMLNWG